MAVRPASGDRTDASNPTARRFAGWARVGLAVSLLVLLGVAALGCGLKDGEQPIAPGQAVKISFIHTTDWHSRLVPYDYQPNRTDRVLGIDER